MKASVKAITNLSLAIFNILDFNFICKQYPEIKLKIFELVKERKLENNNPVKSNQKRVKQKIKCLDSDNDQSIIVDSKEIIDSFPILHSDLLSDISFRSEKIKKLSDSKIPILINNTVNNNGQIKRKTIFRSNTQALSYFSPRFNYNY